MTKGFRLLAVCTVAVAFATSSIAWAQTYTTVDYPGADGTSLNGGPNLQGAAVGSYAAPGIAHGGFVYYRGTFTPVDVPWAGPDGTIPFWITVEGAVVGFYFDSADVQHGFLLQHGQYTTVDFPGKAGTNITGMSPFGEMVGAYSNDVDFNDYHSFIRSRTGQFTAFDPPGALVSFASTINPSGAIVGGYSTATADHGYLLYKGKFTNIDFPGAANYGTWCNANNAEGDIVGAYSDSSGVEHGYLLHNGVFTSIDFPGAVHTSATGINPEGTIVGVYRDTAGHIHGFIRTP